MITIRSVLLGDSAGPGKRGRRSRRHVAHLEVGLKGGEVHRYLITEVPGVQKADLRIEAKGNTIRIAGTKNVEVGEGTSVHRLERRGGRFDRTVSLPIEIDADGIKAECHDGILALYLPRAEHDKPRAITIN